MYWLSCTWPRLNGLITSDQSYEIKSPPWTIFWFRIFGIFSVKNIKRLCVFMFQTWDNSQLLRRVLWISAELTIVSSLKHKKTQPLYIFKRVTVLHLDRLKEGTLLHSFAFPRHQRPASHRSMNKKYPNTIEPCSFGIFVKYLLSISYLQISWRELGTRPIFPQSNSIFCNVLTW